MTADKHSTEYKKMTQEPVAKLVATLALPTLISSIITSAYNTADTYFVGQLGNSATGAVGVVFAIQSIIQALGFGLGMGANSLISRKLGQKDNEAANRYAASSFAASIVVGVVLLISGILALEDILVFLGSTPTILPYAKEYGFYILLGAPLMCSTFVLNNLLRAEGKARFSMVGISVGGVLNVALDPLLIHFFDMGIRGAAIATVSSQAISFIVLISFFLRKKSLLDISPKWISKSFRDYYTIMKTGFPTVCRQGLGSLSTALLNIQVKPYGDAAIAAVSVANKIYMLMRMSLIGIGQGFQPVAGYNFGAGKYQRVKKAFSVAVVIGTVISVCAAIISALFGGVLMSLFRKGDTETIEIGRQMLLYMSVSFPFLGYSTYVNQLYQSLGYVAGASFLASCRQGIFFIPLILLLPSVMGLCGIQITQSAADLLTFVTSVPFHIYFVKKVLSRPDEPTLQDC